MAQPETVQDVLMSHGIAVVFHVTPLHYLPEIMQKRRLLSKVELRKAGFGEDHFRPSSKRRDSASGFDQYLHMMSVPDPPLLLDKLSRSYPHANSS